MKHARNCIRSLQNCDGNGRFQHEDKANLLWESIKERLGHSEYSNIVGVLYPGYRGLPVTV
jgi:hypothetical protein